jgi:hypothetical protein
MANTYKNRKDRKTKHINFLNLLNNEIILDSFDIFKPRKNMG